MKAAVGFIFDMDGTLVDNMPFHIRSWQHLLAERGIQMTAQEIECRNHGILPEVITKLLGNQLAAAEVAAIGDRKEALYRELYRPHLQPLAGCQEFLKTAKRLDIPMAVATMANRVNVAYILDGLGIRDYFTVVIGEEDIQQGKPSPEVFLKAAQGLQLPPENCIVFEDSISGIAAAQQAGMRVVFIKTSLQALPSDARPAIMFSTDSYLNLEPEKLIEYQSV